MIEIVYPDVPFCHEIHQHVVSVFNCNMFQPAWPLPICGAPRLPQNTDVDG